MYTFVYVYNAHVYISVYTHMCTYNVYTCIYMLLKSGYVDHKLTLSQQKMFMKLIPFVHFNTKSCCYLHCYYMTSALFGNNQGWIFSFP